VATFSGRRIASLLHGAPRQLVERLPPPIGLPLRAWKNYPRVHGLHAPAPALQRIVPAGRNAVDAGANRGVYAYLIARRARHVYAFEPIPTLSSYLRRARVSNVTVFTVALSDIAGEATLLVPAVDGEASLGSHVDPAGATALPVRLARLDDFHLDDIGFLKVDVEGHELQVLRGAAGTIQASRPNLLVEIEQRYQARPVADIFDYITGTLAYAHGYAWRRGTLVPLDGAGVAEAQRARAGDRTGGYVNNFVFSDAPLR
jgi:FkbM family methyltransferase